MKFWPSSSSCDELLLNYLIEFARFVQAKVAYHTVVAWTRAISALIQLLYFSETLSFALSKPCHTITFVDELLFNLV